MIFASHKFFLTLRSTRFGQTLRPFDPSSSCVRRTERGRRAELQRSRLSPPTSRIGGPRGRRSAELVRASVAGAARRALAGDKAEVEGEREGIAGDGRRNVSSPSRERSGRERAGGRRARDFFARNVPAAVITPRNQISRVRYVPDVNIRTVDGPGAARGRTRGNGTDLLRHIPLREEGGRAT